MFISILTSDSCQEPGFVETNSRRWEMSCIGIDDVTTVRVEGKEEVKK